MTIRLRFAPSPTGPLHIGGLRTALFCHLMAKSQHGCVILRIEDTDKERSKREYEQSIKKDLLWMGLSYDEGPDEGGDYGPYRQSERLPLYKSLAQQLCDTGHAYPCFLSEKELEELTERAKREGRPPHFYHDRYRDTPLHERPSLWESRPFVIRFKNPMRSLTFTDLVRGKVSFPKDMVGDFVLLRADGSPVYNFCCAVDDWKMNITHVLRAEEHLNNTLRQLLIFEALNAAPPKFAHCSLLIGKDGQKLSKRHGATSLASYREQGYSPTAMANHLCLLGWAHPQEKDIFSLDDIIPLFKIEQLHKAPACPSLDKLKFINKQHMLALSQDDLFHYAQEFIPQDHPFHGQPLLWKKNVLMALRAKVSLPCEFSKHMAIFFGPPTPQEREAAQEVLSWPTTDLVRQYLQQELQALKTRGHPYPTEKIFNTGSLTSSNKTSNPAIFSRGCGLFSPAVPRALIWPFSSPL